MRTLRKSDEADLRQRYPLYVEVGLVLALLLLITAVRVEWRPQDEFDVRQEEQETVQMKEIDQTRQIEKPPPPPDPQVPVEVPDDETVEDASIDLSAELDMSGDQNRREPPPPPEEDEGEENEESEIFMAVQQMPEPVGGTQAIYEKVTYPDMARKAGVEGEVVVNFVVDEEGDVVDPRVVRSLGAGCDEEAVRAIQATEFRPGKQRGKPVKVRMQQRIVFRLD